MQLFQINQSEESSYFIIYIQLNYKNSTYKYITIPAEADARPRPDHLVFDLDFSQLFTDDLSHFPQLPF